MTDVDHRVHDTKVRVLFEIWPLSANDHFSDYYRLKPKDAVARGTSRWVHSGALATWTVPAGLLEEGADYLWRARADDGETVSDYASWYWQLFGVNTTVTPDAQPCPGERFDMITADRVGAALEAMADAHPDLYACAYIDADNGPVVCALPRPGMTDDQSVAAARAEVERVIMATPEEDGYVTDELKRPLVAALKVKLGPED